MEACALLLDEAIRNSNGATSSASTSSCPSHPDPHPHPHPQGVQSAATPHPHPHFQGASYKTGVSGLGGGVAGQQWKARDSRDHAGYQPKQLSGVFADAAQQSLLSGGPGAGGFTCAPRAWGTTGGATGAATGVGTGLLAACGDDSERVQELGPRFGTRPFPDLELRQGGAGQAAGVAADSGRDGLGTAERMVASDRAPALQEARAVAPTSSVELWLWGMAR